MIPRLEALLKQADSLFSSSALYQWRCSVWKCSWQKRIILKIWS